MGVRHGTGEPQLHVEAAAGVKLAPGDGGRHHFQPRLLPALRRAQQRPAVQRLERQRVQHGRHEAGVRGGREPRRALHRRATKRRERQLLLARHAMGNACLYYDSAARRPSGAWPLLGAHRRRELLGLELRLQGDAPALRQGAQGDGGWPGRPHPLCSRHLHSGGQQDQRLPDGSQSAEGRPYLQRSVRHRDAGRLTSGEHGA